MKKRLVFIFKVCILTYLITVVTSCSCKKHKHNYEKSWSMNETYHFQKCTGCEEIANREEHKWDNGVITKEATENTEGEKTYTCEICEKKKVEIIDKIEHLHHFSEKWTSNENQHWHKCEGCEEIIDEEEHKWDNGVITKEATENTEGEKTYTCAICEKKKVEIIDKIEHLHHFSENWTSNENQHWHKCVDCEEIIDKEEHKWDNGIITKEPTETTEGEKTYTCEICEKTKVEKIIKSNSLRYKLSDTKDSYIVTGIGTYKDGDIVIPSIHDGLPIKSIGKDAFSSCRTLKTIFIPESVTNIGEYAFAYCSNLTSIFIPESVTNIGEYAFSSCDNIESMEIPNRVTSIENGLFSGCSSLTSIIIPSSVTSIGNSAFYDCNSLTSITIPNRVTSIGSYAFAYCYSLTSIEIPNSVTSIGSYAFSWCSSLISIKLSNSIKKIEGYAFDYCINLTSIEIPNNVTSIDGCAFHGCMSLENIEIPNSVTSIGYSAFYECDNLRYNEYGNCKYLGNKNNPYLVLIKANNTSIKEVTIHRNTKIIYNYAFKNCLYLKSIVIEKHIINIGTSAFSGCYDLTIYCEEYSEPRNWDPYWNDSNRPVYWAGKWEYVNGVPTPKN